MSSSKHKFLKSALGLEPLKITPLRGDASDRLYSRIFQGPKSYILMQIKEPFLSFAPFLSIQKHFAKNQVAVPCIYFHEKELGFMLLEDLGDITLQHKVLSHDTSENILPLYQKAIEQLIYIHHHATQDRSDCHAFQVHFDSHKFLQEMFFSQKHLLENHFRIKLTDKDQEKLKKEFLDISTRIDQRRQDKCIVHRDFHSRNIMASSDHLKIIDFQDARIAHCQYDLASLLKDAYTNIDTNVQSLLLDDYLIKRQDYGKSFSKDEFLHFYFLHCVQRCFKASGSFASFYHLKKDQRYLKYIPKSVTDTLEALWHFPEYSTFKMILTDIHLTPMV